MTWLLGPASCGPASAGEAKVDFARQIRPLLSNSCFACHGPDENAREAELRLDVRSEAIEEVIVPGKAAQSELLARIRSNDPDERMPPHDSKKPQLTAEQIELFRRWIDQGAEYSEHWALVLPRRPAVPKVRDANWVRSPIDAFILRRLEQAKLSPSPEADRRTLIRRLSFDLTGLPPKAAEVDAFVSDKSPRAYEKVVDRLLSSRHYGERMAAYWLDVVRYADTSGIHGDVHRDHAPYRDYVIKAFNDDKPYDRFVIEQLAGDLLPGATYIEKIASGFNRLNMTTEEGGAQPKEYVAIYQADRVRNTSSIFLGMTLGCAQCHDHKFDPFTIRDFYSFAAFFADVEEAPVNRQTQIQLPGIVHDDRLKKLDGQIAALEKALAARTPDLDAAQAKWEASLKSVVTRPSLQLVSATATSGAKLVSQEDGSFFVEGPRTKDTYNLIFRTDQPRLTGLRLEAIPDDRLPHRGPGRADSGNFVLSELALSVAALSDPAHYRPVTLQNPRAGFNQGGFEVAKAIDKNAGTGWAVYPGGIGQKVTAMFEAKEDFGHQGGAYLLIVLSQNHVDNQHALGRFRISVTAEPRPLDLDKVVVPEQVAAAMRVPLEKRTARQRSLVSAHYRTIAPALNDIRTKLDALHHQRAQAGGKPQSILISKSVQPRMVRILPRGNWLDDSGPVVEPQVPASFGKLDMKDRRPTRLDLARWLTAPDHPLTARVYVNRLWKLAMGHGLVRSLDDFGAQGRQPSHPELLDYLTTQFVADNWSTRRMMKRLVMSATYRQSSLVPSALGERDPRNDLYARASRYRLDAEMVRDNALAVSGLLVPTVGGASVKPYQPAGYWAHLNFPERKWKHDTGMNQYRRGLYTYWCRTFLHPSLAAFDAPSREECSAQRPRSNTPLAALALLNDPTYVESARAFAVMIMKQGNSTPQRIRFAVRRALQREPSPAETKILERLYEKHLAEYQKDPQAAAATQTVGILPLPTDLDAIELAAWTSVARTILNLHESINRN